MITSLTPKEMKVLAMALKTLVDSRESLDEEYLAPEDKEEIKIAKRLLKNKIF